ncbi:MAG: hypothetical protein Q8S36_01690 [Sulfuricurvum sp.]|nr:hypothetical protein [Sulfuricurvum sp.]
MSCLTQEERLGLDEIFLSMSVTPSPFEKCKNFYAHYTPLFRERAKAFSTYTPSRKHLKTYVQAKLFLRTKKEKLGKQLRFSRHK